MHRCHNMHCFVCYFVAVSAGPSASSFFAAPVHIVSVPAPVSSIAAPVVAEAVEDPVVADEATFTATSGP
jgi:hypothetical protein